MLLIHALGQPYPHCAYSIGLVLLVALVCLGLAAALVAASVGRVASTTLLRASLAGTAMLFVPFQPSAASMYTHEHYADTRARLTERGVFCQWLPIYQLDEFVSSRTPAAELAAYRYQGWPRLCDALARRVPVAGEPFADRPHALTLGANALQRANLAHAGGSDQHLRQSWSEVLEHLPPDVLLVRDLSFSGLW